MSHFSIHLSEPLSDVEAKRVAQITAPALGGSPEKLQLLLSRQRGSRIARASNQRQADTVANILRGAGVKVEVLESAADVEAPPSSPAANPVSLLPSPDPFAAPGIPPLNPSVVAQPEDPLKALRADSFSTGKADPFLAGKPDPFLAGKPDPLTAKVDPFAAPKSDPFAAPKSDPFAAPKSDPFAAPKSDPFAAPKSEPFAAPKSDPFAAPKSDPFAAPLATRPAAEASLSPDPFAAPGTNLVVDNKTQQLDLPSQARQARDRPIPRTSVYRQMLLALSIPLVFIILVSLLFQIYSLNISLTRALEARAVAVVSALKQTFQTDLSLLPRQGEINPGPVGILAQKGSDILDSTPDAVFFVAQSAGLGAPAMATRLNIDIESLFQKIQTQRGTFENPTGFSRVEINGEIFLVAYSRLQYRADLNPIGDVYIGFRQTQVLSEALQQVVPTTVALLVVLLVALFITNALARRLTRPIIAATDQANRIALGDLDRSVTVETNDEIGDMLGSLERMRVSLKSMVARLRRNT